MSTNLSVRLAPSGAILAEGHDGEWREIPSLDVLRRMLVVRQIRQHHPTGPIHHAVEAALARLPAVRRFTLSGKEYLTLSDLES